MSALPWSVSGDTVIVRVRLTPKADRDRIDGVRMLAEDDHVLAVRVRAAPEKGAANAALVALVAAGLGLSRSSVSISRGRTARVKTLTITGAPGDVHDRLAALVE